MFYLPKRCVDPRAIAVDPNRHSNTHLIRMNLLSPRFPIQFRTLPETLEVTTGNFNFAFIEQETHGIMDVNDWPRFKLNNCLAIFVHIFHWQVGVGDILGCQMLYRIQLFCQKMQN